MKKIVIGIIMMLVVSLLLLPACTNTTPTPTPTPTSAPTSTPTQEPITIDLQASSTTTSSMFPHAVAWADVVQKNVPAVKSVTVKEGAGTSASVKLMKEGTIRIASTAAMSGVYAAYYGLDIWKDAGPWKDLRGFTTYTQSAVYWAVREDSGITDITGLQGKKISAGGGGSTQAEAMAACEANGIAPDWQMLSHTEGANAVKDRIQVGYVKTGNGIQVDATFLDVKSTTALRILSFTEAQKKTASAKYPWLGWITVPAGAIRDYPTTTPIITQVQTVGEFTTNAFPQELGYQIAKAIITHWPDMVAAFSGSKDYDPVKDCIAYWDGFENSVPLHAGLVQYFQEVGATVPAKLIPPEYVKK